MPRPSENDEDAITSVDDEKVESSKSEVERMSHHSYEEIAASEANSEVINYFILGLSLGLLDLVSISSTFYVQLLRSRSPKA